MTTSPLDVAALRTGVQMQYMDRGVGPAVVLLHGYSDTWYSYGQVLPRLPGSLRALAPTQRGHGNSSRVDDYAMEAFAEDVIALLDALEIERAALVGHSMGSFIARAAALARPERVSHLALLGSAVSADNPVIRELVATIADLGDDIDRDFVRAFQQSTMHRSILPSLLETLVSESLLMPPPVWRQALAALLAYDDRARLGQIAAPTWVVWGAEDQIFTRAEQNQLVASIPGATFTAYDDVGHAVHWEIPERFTEDLVAFLDA